MIRKLFLFIFLTIHLSFFGQISDLNTESIKNDTVETIKYASAFPNPFSNKTQISFTSTKNQNVVFEVKNVLGVKVYESELNATSGKNNLDFFKKNLPPGMYLYSLQTDNEIISKRLVLR